MEIVVDEHPQFPKEQKIFALLENNTDLTSADFSSLVYAVSDL